jgi:hypothetical protein
MTTLLEEFRWQARTSYDWLEKVVRDVTSEQANWVPPGRANTIAATYAHIVYNADEDLNHWLFKRPRFIETTWKGRAGVDAPHGDGFDWSTFTEVDWPDLREYGRMIRDFVVSTIDSLTEQDLEIPTDLSTPDIAQWHGIDIVRLTVGHHIRMHGGEIATLKGLQGAKGYNFGRDATRP